MKQISKCLEVNIPANEASDPIKNIMEHEEPEVCDCGNKDFEVKINCGAGGSGTYLYFTCSKCSTVYCMDFDNPDYEG